MARENSLAPFKRIQVKSSLFVLFLILFTTLALSIITVRIVNQHLRNELARRAESLCRSTASTAGYSLSTKDLLGFDNLVFKIKGSNSDIQYIAIIGANGEIIAHSEIKKMGEIFHPAAGNELQKREDGTAITEIRERSRRLLEIQSPVVFMSKPLGSVVLGIDESVLINTQREVKKKLLGAFVLLMIIGLLSSVLLSSFLTRPIRELSEGVAELKEGKLSRPLRVYSRDELGRLTESFNEMTALITSQQDSLSKYAQELEEAYISTVRVLAAAIDARDKYTLGHSTRVAQLSVELGRDLGLSPPELEELEIACLFHDVGKIKLPDSILHKKDRLDALEEREMMRHAEYGTEILSTAPSLRKYLPAVRHHHEWHDGTGYPDRLGGDKIPQAAAIISLADVYDAMTTDRPYRHALTKEEALKNIAELAGKQFEPNLALRFIRLRERMGVESARRPT